MLEHSAHKILPYKALDLFDLVADVSAYPEFLPLCMAVNIEEASKNSIIAKLTIGEGLLHTYFISNVTLHRTKLLITMQSVQSVQSVPRGPLNSMEGQWKFQKTAKGTEIDFNVAFKLKAKLFAPLLEKIFARVAQNMLKAFINRAEQTLTPINVKD